MQVQRTRPIVVYHFLTPNVQPVSPLVRQGHVKTSHRKVRSRHAYHPTPFKKEQVVRIPSYLDQGRVSQSRCASRSSSRSSMSESECAKLRQELLNGGDYTKIESEKLERVCANLREYSAEKVAKREYEKAKEANELYACLRDELKERKEEFFHRTDPNANYEQMKAEKVEKDKQELEEFDQKWKNRETEMLKEQKKKLDEFEEKWQTVYPQKYRKQSEKLIHLQELEKKAGIAADLDQAVRLREEVKKLEREEMERAQEQLIKDYTVARSKLDSDQKEERELFEDSRKHWREIILARQKNEMDSIKKREVVLNVKKERVFRQVDTSFDIMGRERQEAVVHRDRGKFDKEKDKLLPPLIPPNDRRIKERQQQILKQRREQQERFRQHIEEKDREVDRSGPSSARDSEVRPKTVKGGARRSNPSTQHNSAHKRTPREGSSETRKQPTPKEEAPREFSSSASLAPKSSAKETPKDESSAPHESSSSSPRASSSPPHNSSSNSTARDSPPPPHNSSAKATPRDDSPPPHNSSAPRDDSPPNKDSALAPPQEEPAAEAPPPTSDSSQREPMAFKDIIREVYIPKDYHEDDDKANSGRQDQVNFV